MTVDLEADGDADGSLRLPDELLRRHGLGSGGKVFLKETEDGIVIQSFADRLRQAQEWSRRVLGDPPSLTVDDFIAERRLEALRELSDD